MADDDAKTPDSPDDTDAQAEDVTSSDAAGAFRAVGQALGGFARRVGAFAATTVGRPVIPEAVKESLAAARASVRRRSRGCVGEAARRRPAAPE